MQPQATQAITGSMSATLTIRGVELHVEFNPAGDEPIRVLRVYPPECPDNILALMSDDSVALLRVEALKRQREQEAYMRRAIEAERLEA